MVWGTHRGVETPRKRLLALPAGAWEKANADYVQQLSWTQTPSDLAEEQFPKFGVVSDGEHEAIFDLEYPHTRSTASLVWRKSANISGSRPTRPGGGR